AAGGTDVNRRGNKIRICLEVIAAANLAWDINETGCGVERPRRPYVTTTRTGHHLDWSCRRISRFRVYDRPAGLQIHSGGPRYGDPGIGGQQFASTTVEHVKESILWRMHQHLTHSSVDTEIGEHDVRNRVVVPIVTGNFLVVPDELSRRAAHGKNGV